MTIELKLTFPLSTGNNYKTINFARRKVFVTKKGQMYRMMVKSDLNRQFGRESKTFDSPINVDMVIVPPDRRRRDIDNICKTLWDALTMAGLWTDDKLIHNLHVSIAEPQKPGWIDMKVETR